MWIFKLFGAAIALAAAALLSRKYSEHLAYRASLTRGFAQLLLHIKGKISVYLAPPSELISGFENEALMRSGFIALAGELGSPRDAYLKTRDRLLLGDAARRTLDGYFNAFGAVYKDELLALTETASAELLREAKEREDALPRDKKLSRTLIFATALGAIILFI